MRALVTGGAGLIGSHLVDLLLERGYAVRILDNLDPVTHPAGKPPWVPADAEFVEADVRDAGALWRATVGCDVVFHQAAFGGFAPEPSKMLDVNATGTARVMEAARRCGVRKVVVASSQAVYGHGEAACPECWGGSARRSLEQLAEGRWEPLCPRCGNVATSLKLREASENRPPTPIDVPSAYAVSKYAAERLALNLGDEWGLPVVALRYALTYGSRQSLSNPYTGICSIFATRLLNGLPPWIYEDGQQTRDFTYVSDVAAAEEAVN